MSKPVFYSRHSGGLTLYMEGKPMTVASSHPNFSEILQALSDKAWEKVKRLMDVVGTINKFGVSKKFAGRRVFVENGKVYFTDSHNKHREMGGPLVQRILDDLSKPSAEKYADALLQFYDNVMKNPLKDIRKELYEFLESGKTPITSDGCFLAYKKVRAPNEEGEYLDIYSGSMDNAPGSIVRMRQADVDTNRHNVCSRGLHFCSRNYLDQYGSWDDVRVVVVKVNPKHVFAIPTDYNYQKGRASEYHVVGEVDPNWRNLDDVFKDSFIDEDSKEAAAPKVKFKGTLRAGLPSLAKSYGLTSNEGRVRMGVKADGSMIPIRVTDTSGYVDIIGTPVQVVDVKYMSIETKSVREALKAAVEKAEGSEV